MFKYFSVLALVLISSNLYAGGSISEKTIARTHVNTDSGFYFRTVETAENPDGCSDSYWYHVNMSGVYAKELFAVILGAQMSKKKVQFYVSGCSKGGASGYPVVTWANTY